MEFPTTDAEIRMYCIESTKSDGKPDVEAAQKMYDFICPPSSSKSKARKKKPRVSLFGLRKRIFYDVLQELEEPEVHVDPLESLFGKPQPKP